VDWKVVLLSVYWMLYTVLLAAAQAKLQHAERSVHQILSPR
jgi:hypothetical protein